jgi:CNT family concentrative nucleoside transporter
MWGPQNAQSLIGLALTMAICWAFSEDRRRFPWKLAVGAILIQLALVLLLFGVPAARGALDGVGHAVDGLASSTQAGTEFVFGYLAGGDQPYPLTNAGATFVFAFRVLPVILVVCALSALLWHWGILKAVTRAFGFLFQKTLGLRGPPALATAATIFLGQVEGPIFIRAYLDRLSRSELFTLMAVGLSCVSGSTMVAYATILKASLPNAAAHVLTASIISAPAGVLLARILVPPSPLEEVLAAEEGSDRKYDSSIDAVIRGTGDGLTVLLNVAATLIVFVAFVALADKLLGLLPAVGGKPVSIVRVLGAIFMPLAWTLGVPWREAGQGGALLGTKLVLTEFSAFIKLGQIPAGELSERTRIIMTYALCGFANIASVGITAAGFGVLAPDRRGEVLRLVWRALLAGFLATCMTASMIGALPSALFHSPRAVTFPKGPATGADRTPATPPAQPIRPQAGKSQPLPPTASPP